MPMSGPRSLAEWPMVSSPRRAHCRCSWSATTTRSQHGHAAPAQRSSGDRGAGSTERSTTAIVALAALDVDRVVVAHADLPMATDLAWPARHDGVTLVPDRRDDGTNVACVPTRAGFEFSYGPGSFRRHGAEARRLGLPLRVVREPSLGWDVDLPSDLDHPAVTALR